jgi:hypothetical protein
MAGILALPLTSTTATTPDRWEAVWKLGLADAAWAISNQDRAAGKTLPGWGLATAAPSPLQSDTPPSSRRLGALLSCLRFGGYEEGR